MSRTSNYRVGAIRQSNESAILDAAKEEFAMHGFKGASVGNIADQANVARPNVHYYFKNKETLYRAVLLSIVRGWIQLFDQIKTEDDPAEALLGYIKAKVMYSKTDPLASRVYANELLHGGRFLKEYLFGEHSEWFESKIKVLNAWIDSGKMDPVDPASLFFLIWSSTQYYADYSVQVDSIYGHPLSEEDYEKVADELGQIILKGCGLSKN